MSEIVAVEYEICEVALSLAAAAAIPLTPLSARCYEEEEEEEATEATESSSMQFFGEAETPLAMSPTTPMIDCGGVGCSSSSFVAALSCAACGAADDVDGDEDVDVDDDDDDADDAAVIDRIATMRLQEESAAYRCSDYLAFTDDIDAECRAMMCRWSTQVVDFCKFSRETVSIAMNYLDRFMTTSITSQNPFALMARTSRKQYQLASMASLYIAVKIHEPLEMDTALVSELSRGCYSPIEIAMAEMEILNALGWRTSGPTPLEFFRHFLALLPPRRLSSRVMEGMLKLGKAQAEFSAADFELSAAMVSPSKVGMAALLNALEAMEATTTYRDDDHDDDHDDAGVELDMLDEEERSAFLKRLGDAINIGGVDPSLDDDVKYARSILAESLPQQRPALAAPTSQQRQQQRQQRKSGGDEEGKSVISRSHDAEEPEKEVEPEAEPEPELSEEQEQEREQERRTRKRQPPSQAHVEDCAVANKRKLSPSGGKMQTSPVCVCVAE